MTNKRIYSDEAYIGTTPQMRYWRTRAFWCDKLGLCSRCSVFYVWDEIGNIIGAEGTKRKENYSLCEEHLKQQRGYYKPKGRNNEQSNTV